MRRESPNWIKNPENDPERVAVAPNGIKNPENDPERVAVAPNWIKNPENDPERVAVAPNWIKNPENDPPAPRPLPSTVRLAASRSGLRTAFSFDGVVRLAGAEAGGEDGFAEGRVGVKALVVIDIREA